MEKKKDKMLEKDAVEIEIVPMRDINFNWCGKDYALKKGEKAKVPRRLNDFLLTEKLIKP